MANSYFTITVFADKSIDQALISDITTDIQRFYLENMAHTLQQYNALKHVRLLSESENEILDAISTIRVNQPDRARFNKVLWAEVTVPSTSRYPSKARIGCAARIHEYDGEALAKQILDNAQPQSIKTLFIKKLKVFCEYTFIRSILQMFKLLPFDIGTSVAIKLRDKFATMPLSNVIVDSTSMNEVSLKDKRFSKYSYRFAKMLIMEVHDDTNRIEVLMFPAKRLQAPSYLTYPITRAGSFSLYETINI